MAGKKNREKFFEVDKIVDERDVNGKIQYKVHWKGYDNSEDTWEPEANLRQCESIITEYRSEKVSSSSEKNTPPKIQTVLSSDEETATPKRQRKSLSRSSRSRSRSTSRSRGLPHAKPSSPQKTPAAQVVRSPRDYSPGIYHFRSSTVSKKTGLPIYLSSDEEGETALGRRRLRTTYVSETSTTQSHELPASGPSEEQTDVINPPSWMQLGYAELFFCLAILVTIVGIIWYLSLQNFKITP